MAAASPLANRRVMFAYKHARQCHCDTDGSDSAAAGSRTAGRDAGDADAGGDADGDGDIPSLFAAATCVRVM